MEQQVKRVNSMIQIDDGKIIFKPNFSGEPDKFNSKGGRRYFNIVLEDQGKYPDQLVTQRYGGQPLSVDKLIEDGWNVKFTRPRDEDEAPTPYIEVSVTFGAVPPKIVEVTSKNQLQLDEDTVGTLDHDQLERIDLDIRPYNWEVNEKHGVKAYLKTMYAKIVEDRFTDRYGSFRDGD